MLKFMIAPAPALQSGSPLLVRQKQICGPLSTAQQQVHPTRVEPLWPAGTPGIEAGPDAPHLDLYLAPQNPTHTVVIVIPGGGYGCVAQANEGIPLAQWFNAHGVSAAVLTYRIAPDYHYPAPLEDGRRAVQWVRRHAAELNAQPDHVGLLGFSAGGHLAAFTAATAFDPLPAGWLNPPDFAGVSSRPDFLALGYPVITMKERTHGGSRTNLLGLAADDKAMQEQLSVETRITGDMPPSFLFSTTDDPSVPIANSIDFYQSMVLAGAPVEMHLYEHGRHGLGLAEESVEVTTWPSLLANWMAMHKWMALASIDTSPKSPGTATSSPAGTSPLRTNE
jgi:acetyl esterase/lipase